MGIAEEYVDLRLQRLQEEDLQRKPNKWLAALPQCARARRVLDIACGLGYDSLAWVRAGKEVIGIDLNYELLRNASRLAESQKLKVRFVVSRATSFPFADDSFDICYAENIFEHVPDWEKIVKEAHRVLAPGGVFFIVTTNRLCPINHEINHMHFYPLLPEWLKRPILNWVVKHKPAWVNYSRFPAVNWFTYRGLARSLQDAGFDALEVFDVVDVELLSARARKFGFLLRLLREHPALRYLLYPLLVATQVFGIKRPAEAGPLPQVANEQSALTGAPPA
ncbi:MAG: methyltransferase domain-containing protein [Terriglobales bacterium]